MLFLCHPLVLRSLMRLIGCLGLLATCAVVLADENDLAESPGHLPKALRATLTDYCLHCHGTMDREGDFDLERLLADGPQEHVEDWERVLGKVVARQMPPIGEERPPNEVLETLTGWIDDFLDQDFRTRPNPGRTDTFRRLSRTEYQNAVRDLLAVEIDATKMLPPDESSNGFDNITVGDLPPTLLTRYVEAAQRISRLAIARPGSMVEGHTFRVAPDVTQEGHVRGLPLGSRGGLLISHNFPSDGTYEIHVHLSRDRNEKVEGLNGKYQMDVLLDRSPVASFDVAPPRNSRQYFFDDDKLRAQFFATAGPHQLGVTFHRNKSSLLETKREPLNVHFNTHRHPRLTPAVYQVSLTGPLSPSAPQPVRVETPSRDKVFSVYPQGAEDEAEVAEQLLGRLARLAYRQPVAAADLSGPMEFYRRASAEAGFEAGIEAALASMLVSSKFLFRIEREPPNIAAGQAYPINDLELASRLSFFLWSSIPDEELLALAEQSKLREPGVLEQQVARMLRDGRSRSLVVNFANQWLYLRNLDSRTPDARVFPDFDENLRQSMKRETELLVRSVIDEDRSCLDLIRADYTYLDERLAKHYEIPHVYGSRFRRIDDARRWHRGGLLRQGSILTVSSYATRTSPVVRGHWILENVMGTPTPPPPPDVPTLEENVIGAELTIRERLAAHRANAACASCHDIIDPIGFALENFDAVGRWRDYELGEAISPIGELADGTEFAGVDGLEKALLKRPQLFMNAMVERLFTFALGRSMTSSDGPAIRRVVRDAGPHDYRFSAVVTGISRSPIFQMRMSK